MKWKKITEEQIDFFDKNGYVIVRDALNNDLLERLVNAGDRLVASDRIKNRTEANKSSDGFRDVVSVDSTFLSLLTHPTTVPLVVQLMGPHLQLHTSHLIWKQADPDGTPPSHRAPGWHRDIATVTRDIDDACMPRLEIKIAYFLSDCSQPQCGQTMVTPGSHRWKSIEKGKGDPPGTIEPMLSAGDALLFENRTLHAGGANLSGRIRKTVMFGYSHRWVRPDDYDFHEDALLERCDPIQRCLLDARGMNYDAEGRFVPKGEKTALEILAETNGCRTAACH